MIQFKWYWDDSTEWLDIRDGFIATYLVKKPIRINNVDYKSSSQRDYIRENTIISDRNINRK